MNDSTPTRGERRRSGTRRQCVTGIQVVDRRSAVIAECGEDLVRTGTDQEHRHITERAGLGRQPVSPKSR